MTDQPPRTRSTLSRLLGLASRSSRAGSLPPPPPVPAPGRAPGEQQPPAEDSSRVLPALADSSEWDAAWNQVQDRGQPEPAMVPASRLTAPEQSASARTGSVSVRARLQAVAWHGPRVPERAAVAIGRSVRQRFSAVVWSGKPSSPAETAPVPEGAAPVPTVDAVFGDLDW
ncbi:MAG: hypothetical protein EA398_03665 [Deltaproteobacteria bacterium]|nr:MAG: hypothetical protein EA398_03665 [Deltaproteobacteria bacterium]